MNQRAAPPALQTGDPSPGDAAGPKGLVAADGKLRTIPLEILALGDKEPTYGVRVLAQISRIWRRVIKQTWLSLPSLPAVHQQGNSVNFPETWNWK